MLLNKYTLSGGNIIMKKQIFVIGVIVLFAGLTVNPAIAQDFKGNELQETMNVEFTLVNPDGFMSTERIDLTEQEFVELQTTISDLLEKLELATDLDDVEKIIGSTTFQGGAFLLKHPILAWILDFLSFYKLPRSRSFVISQGHGFKMIPFKNHKIDIYRPFTLWQYSDRWGYDLPDKTLVFKPSPFNIEFLHGRQIGMMNHFFGIYIFVSQPTPQKCWTFFMGSARRVVGVDFTLSPFM